MTLRPQPTNTRRPADIQAARDHAVRLIGKVCQVAGSASFVDDARFYLRWHGVLAAIKRHDSAPIFDWLVRTASYHGIADRVATQYMEAHGYMRWGTWRRPSTVARSAPSWPATGSSTAAATPRRPTPAPGLT